MSAIKKKRTCNFSQDEKILLVNMVCEKKHVVENKKTDAQSTSNKNLAWRFIWKKYNEQSSTYRTVESLKYLWENLKRNAKKKYVNAGGESNSIREDPLLSKVYNIIKVSLHGMNNQLDSDYHDNEGMEHETMCESSKENDVELDEFEATSNSPSQLPLVLKEQANISYPAPYVHVIARIPKQENAHAQTDITYIETQQIPNTTQVLQIPNTTQVLQIPNTTQILQIPNATQVLQIPSSSVPVGTSKDETQRIGQQGQPSLQSSTDILVEAKIALMQTTKQHAIDEELRKKELFNMQIEKEKIHLEILKLDLMRKKLEFEQDFPDL